MIQVNEAGWDRIVRILLGIGMLVLGWGGFVTGTFGVILPSLVLMLVITLTYLKLREQPWFKNIFQKLRWLTLGLIGAAMVLIAKGAFTDWFTVLVFVISLAIYWKFKTNPIYLMLGAAVFGMVFG